MSLDFFTEVERKIPRDLFVEIFQPSFPRKISALYDKYKIKYEFVLFSAKDFVCKNSESNSKCWVRQNWF